MSQLPKETIVSKKAILGVRRRQTHRYNGLEARGKTFAKNEILATTVWATNPSAIAPKWVVNQETLAASMTPARRSFSHTVVRRPKKLSASAWHLARILGVELQVGETRRENVSKKIV